MTTTLDGRATGVDLTIPASGAWSQPIRFTNLAVGAASDWALIVRRKDTAQVVQRIVGTTNTSANLTGTFTAADVGHRIVGAGIPAGTTILSQTGTAAVMSANATATDATTNVVIAEAVIVPTITVDGGTDTVTAALTALQVGGLVGKGAQSFYGFWQLEHLAESRSYLSGAFTVDRAAPAAGSAGVLEVTIEDTTIVVSVLVPVDPSDFEAAGNVAAEAAARADADALLIPLTQRAAASGVATLDSNSVVPRSQRGNDVFNALQYFPANSGSATGASTDVDCASGWNTAMAAMSAAGGGVFLIPAGTYRLGVAATLDFATVDGIEIRGVGRGATTLILDPAAGGAGISITGRNKITFRNLSVRARLSQAATQANLRMGGNWSCPGATPGTLTVDSTTGFDSTGTLAVATGGNDTQTTAYLTYTGKTSTTFTGVTGGAGLSGSVDSTTVTGGSFSLPAATITLADAVNFPNSGVLIMTSDAGLQYVTYTGFTGSFSGGATFTGCSGGTGTVANGSTVYAAGTVSPAVATHGIQFGPASCTDILLDNVGFFYFENSGLRSSMTTSAAISRMTVRDCDFHDINNSTSVSNQGGAMLANALVDSLIHGNTFRANGHSGKFHQALYCSPATSSPITNLAITDNHFEGQHARIQFNGAPNATGVTITGNQFNGVEGSQMQYLDYSVIANNTWSLIFGEAGLAVSINGDVTFTNNLLTASAQQYIMRVTATGGGNSSPSITGNRIISTASTTTTSNIAGIDLSCSTDTNILVANNTVQGTAGGVAAVLGTGHIIRGNRLYVGASGWTGTVGVYLAAAATGCLVENNVISVTGGTFAIRDDTAGSTATVRNNRLVAGSMLNVTTCSGTLANRPSATHQGLVYYATDTKFAYIATGIAWVTMAMIPGVGLDASKPTAGLAGALYYSTDVNGGTLYVDNGSSWLSNTAILSSIGTAKGDLVTFTGSGTPVRLGVGADGTSPVADANSSSGILWARAASPSLIVSGSYMASPGVWSTSGVAQDRVYYTPLLIRKRSTINAMALDHVSTAGGAGSIGRLGIYANHATDDKPDALVIEATTGTQIDLTTAAAFKASPAISQALNPGLYWLACVTQVATGAILRAMTSGAMSVPNSAAGTQTTGYTQNSVTGALPANASGLSAAATTILAYVRTA